MKILLVSATKFEINPLLKKLKKVSSGDALSKHRFGKHSVDVLITGVGMTATAFHLGSILRNKYALVVNAGVAGSFNKSIPPGTVVNVVSDCFADMGSEDGGGFMTLEELGLDQQISGSRFKAQGLNNKRQTANIKQVIGSLPQVNAITVNTVHGNTASIKKVVKKFNPDIESMEGAAFFFACQEFKTSCVQVRAISNYVERRNKKNWKLDIAVNSLNAFLERLFFSL